MDKFSEPISIYPLSQCRAHFSYLFPPAVGDELWPDATLLGRAGGPMEQNGHGPPGKTPQALGELDNPCIPAAYTYMGQLIDHDISLDKDSTTNLSILPPELCNYRTPQFDLDQIYGNGPKENAELYDGARGQLAIGSTTDNPLIFRDLPRNADGSAKIWDCRQDENLLIAQLHVAFIKFHNTILQRILSGGLTDQCQFGESPFEQARRLVCWHYQWIILKEYLPAITSNEIVQDILDNGRRLYDPKNIEQIPTIPVEFSAAAFRFGHSQIQPGYAINICKFSGEITSLPLFPHDPAINIPIILKACSSSRLDLRGGPIHSADRVVWNLLIDDKSGSWIPGTTTFSSKINSKLASPLFYLPNSAQAAVGSSLATLDLLRGQRLKICSGEAAAANAKQVYPQINVLKPDQIWAGSELQPYRNCSTPLWFYILREAEISYEGKRLGELGSRIVAEVIVGLLTKDRNTYLNAAHPWVPTLGSTYGQFDLISLFRIAKVIDD